jgi:hypothetical protein
MPIALIFFALCLLIGFSPILATTVVEPTVGFEQSSSDASLKPNPTKLDMYIDPDTMDIYEQPEGLDKNKK